MVRVRSTSYSQPQEQCNLQCDKKLMPHDRRFVLHDKYVDLPRASTCRTTLFESSQYLQLKLLQVANYSSVASKSFSLSYLDPGIYMFNVFTLKVHDYSSYNILVYIIIKLVVELSEADIETSNIPSYYNTRLLEVWSRYRNTQIIISPPHIVSSDWLKVRKLIGFFSTLRKLSCPASNRMWSFRTFSSGQGIENPHKMPCVSLLAHWAFQRLWTYCVSTYCENSTNKKGEYWGIHHRRASEEGTLRGLCRSKM